MEQPAVTTDLEERELKAIGRRVAEALEPSTGRAIPAARRKLFEEQRESSLLGGRWVIGLAAAGAVAAVAFGLRGDDPPGSAPRSGAPRAPAAGAPSSPESGGAIRAVGDATARVESRADGAAELILENGEARGRLGAGDGPRAVAAGPYRVTGEAEVFVRWSATEGLLVEVTHGEARVLAAGATPLVVPAGTSKTLPPRR
jgi:hypothetical protein